MTLSISLAMLRRRCGGTLMLVSMIAAVPAMADVTIVSENFDGFADSSALYSVWEPRAGTGAAAATNPDDGILTSDSGLFPNIEGNAVDHIGNSVLQWTGLVPGSPINPTAEQSIKLSVDIYDDASGNKRMSAGLRNRQDTVSTANENLIELGFWNANTFDPVDPANAPPRGSGQRHSDDELRLPASAFPGRRRRLGA